VLAFGAALGILERPLRTWAAQQVTLTSVC